MKSICITGYTQSGLEQVHAILELGGMRRAKAAQRDPLIDLRTWHARVMASAAEEAPAGQPVRPSGRLWEQLASDLFLANLSSQLWGWSDTASGWLLDFWRDFEPKLYFILVCISPREMLAELVAAGGEEEDMAAAVAMWQAQHQEMLRFHLRHPQRSLLVGLDDCRRHPDRLLAVCAERWNLPLTATGDARAVPAPADDEPLAAYLTARLHDAYPDTASLQQELEATVLWLEAPAGEAAATPISLPQAIAGYRRLNTAQHALAQALAEAKSEREQHRQSRLAQQRLKEELDGAQGKLRAAQAAPAPAPGPTPASVAQLREAEQENQLMLLQLHQVQEELERQFTRNQQLQFSLEQAERRWQRMLGRHPGYHDYLSLDMSAADGGVDWRLREFSAAGRGVANIEVRSVLEAGMGGLQFRRGAAGSPLLRWPAAADGEDVLTLIPAGSADNTRQRLACLLDLASSDWDLLQTLGTVLGEAAAGAAPAALPDGVTPQALSTGLLQFSSTLKTFPAVLRFDHVTLVREQVNPDYEHLWIGLDNVSLGAVRCARFEFRLACGNVRPQSFGSHPKLEFPQEGGQAPFENWFAETADDFGDKLELRFAAPDAMDVGVWRKLSARDHALVAALLERVPAILAVLQAQDISPRRGWQDWLALAAGMRQIVARQGQ